MCALEPLFSLIPICHFPPPTNPTSPQNAASCPSLVPLEVPPSPSGMAQDFTLSLSNIQEVRQTSLQLWSWTWTLSKLHVVKMIGIKQRHMVGFASSWVKHRWKFVCCYSGQWMSETWMWVISVLWDRYESEEWVCVFMLMLLTAQLFGPTMYLVSNCDWLSCASVSTAYSTMCSGSEAALSLQELYLTPVGLKFA